MTLVPEKRPPIEEYMKTLKNPEIITTREEALRYFVETWKLSETLQEVMNKIGISRKAALLRARRIRNNNKFYMKRLK